MSPSDIAVDAHDNLYVADYAAVRKIDRHGRISSVAGTGKWPRKPDPEQITGGPRTRFTAEHQRATDAMLIADDVALDRHGNLYIADSAGDRVYKVNGDGIIKTVARTVSGNGTRLGDGGPATSAFIDGAAAVAVDRAGRPSRRADPHGRPARHDHDHRGHRREGLIRRARIGDQAQPRRSQRPRRRRARPRLPRSSFNARIRAVRYEHTQP